MGTSKLCEFFDHMICCLELEEMMELWEKIALIKIFPADEPTDEIGMQPALHFPPNIEHNSTPCKYSVFITQTHKYTNTKRNTSFPANTVSVC